MVNASGFGIPRRFNLRSSKSFARADLLGHSLLDHLWLRYVHINVCHFPIHPHGILIFGHCLHFLQFFYLLLSNPLMLQFFTCPMASDWISKLDNLLSQIYQSHTQIVGVLTHRQTILAHSLSSPYMSNITLDTNDKLEYVGAFIIKCSKRLSHVFKLCLSFSC